MLTEITLTTANFEGFNVKPIRIQLSFIDSGFVSVDNQTRN